MRLRQGDYAAVSRYDTDPAAVARRFFSAGARRLHVVDLDAAKAGHPVNTAAVTAILAVAREYEAAVQVGGGLRDHAALNTLLDAGASYAILGTAAVKNAAFRREAIAAHPQRIIIGVDAKDGKVAVSGWQEEGGVADTAFLAELHDAPPAAVIYTDIARDGMLNGNNTAATAAAAAAAPCPLIASGGIGGLAHVEALKAAGGIAGVVIGKALYTGDLALDDALKLCA